ncbi:MAG: glycine cleavage system aminomethyltransferase GcvT [Bacilli bacterium]|nr:glycine cleavage system aminomethyltransferase GcvT [Bacilli bacterium]MDD3121012.1 glycine cleavage system aminomethyltransferase GcvT [Bacilli bacterium]MDD4063186.1 glycine cleavage system aminomethyltransferase GcvT [Bacilli bacterium]MDY0363767.1 glycine cleavage system aminomethyltransferase GcvT [Bacilli bacterium]
MKKTILYDEHVKRGGSIVEFGGYLMPIQYQGIPFEHDAVRNNLGVFDCSHMGEILIEGRDALLFADYIVTSNIGELNDMRMLYGFILYPDGGIVDDLMVYKYNSEKILLVVNAANTIKDYKYIISKFHNMKFNCTVTNVSATMSQLALQGPKAADYLQNLVDINLDDMIMYDFLEMKINNIIFLVSRSGYTGEDGFEIYGSNNDILELFIKLADDGVTLCGLGARDTLRFEAGLPLYGHEISESINPLESGLSFALAFEKDFFGKDVLLEIKKNKLKRKEVGLELIGRGIPRNGYLIYKNNKEIGYVTTGYMIPNTKNSYAVALIDNAYYEKNGIVEVLIHNKHVQARIRSKRFITNKYKK